MKMSCKSPKKIPLKSLKYPFSNAQISPISKKEFKDNNTIVNKAYQFKCNNVNDDGILQHFYFEIAKNIDRFIRFDIDKIEKLNGLYVTDNYYPLIGISSIKKYEWLNICDPKILPEFYCPFLDYDQVYTPNCRPNLREIFRKIIDRKISKHVEDYIKTNGEDEYFEKDFKFKILISGFRKTENGNLKFHDDDKYQFNIDDNSMMIILGTLSCLIPSGKMRRYYNFNISKNESMFNALLDNEDISGNNIDWYDINHLLSDEEIKYYDLNGKEKPI